MSLRTANSCVGILRLRATSLQCTTSSLSVGSFTAGSIICISLQADSKPLRADLKRAAETAFVA